MLRGGAGQGTPPRLYPLEVDRGHPAPRASGHSPLHLLGSGSGAARNDVLFVGEEGALIADSTRRVLLGEDRFAGLVEPTAIPVDRGARRTRVAQPAASRRAGDGGL